MKHYPNAPFSRAADMLKTAKQINDPQIGTVEIVEIVGGYGSDILCQLFAAAGWKVKKIYGKPKVGKSAGRRVQPRKPRKSKGA